MANVVRDFEPDMDALTLRPFDDGRFRVFLNGRKIFDMERTGKFPTYEAEIKPALDEMA